MFENPRRGRRARNSTTNVPKILDLKSSFEQTFSELTLGAPVGSGNKAAQCTVLIYSLTFDTFLHRTGFGSASCESDIENQITKYPFQLMDAFTPKNGGKIKNQNLIMLSIVSFSSEGRWLRVSIVCERVKRKACSFFYCFTHLGKKLILYKPERIQLLKRHQREQHSFSKNLNHRLFL